MVSSASPMSRMPTSRNASRSAYPNSVMSGLDTRYRRFLNAVLVDSHFSGFFQMDSSMSARTPARTAGRPSSAFVHHRGLTPLPPNLATMSSSEMLGGVELACRRMSASAQFAFRGKGPGVCGRRVV